MNLGKDFLKASATISSMISRAIQDIVIAIQQLFSSASYRVIALAAWILFLLLFAYLVIFSIPGNDLEFFLSISQPYELVAILLVSIGMAVVTTMNIYIFRVHMRNMKTASIGIGAVAANTVSLVLISASCTACLAALAGVIVAPILFTLFEYRVYAVGFSLILLVVSLYYASLKIVEKCEHCRVPHLLKKTRKRK